VTEPGSGNRVHQGYRLARQQYAELGVDTDAAIAKLRTVAISLHCWQGDDVGGFENAGESLGGGLAVTGNYPGKARTPDELRADLDKALCLIPGKHRLNLHASYAETGSAKVDRDQLQPEHFRRWIDWAVDRGLGLDFNPTYFSHPMAADGFTLAHADKSVRDFWVNHGIACRRIGAEMGRATGSPCVVNVWIPDGLKDTPVDRITPRIRLAESLDKIFAAPLDPAHHFNAVEGKLFGIGSESYVVGSHEFYLGYAITRKILPTLDSGHYHPTETIADKISAYFQYVPRLLLHVSRGVRWDSDHVVTLSDELLAIAAELVRGNYLGRVHLGLDYFDGSINRVAAWVIGARNLQKALLSALLEPIDRLRKAEVHGDFTSRLALLEEMKSMPVGAVWDQFCEMNDAPVGTGWIEQMTRYDGEVRTTRK
jgi:L-rhamnose isomerase